MKAQRKCSRDKETDALMTRLELAQTNQKVMVSLAAIAVKKDYAGWKHVLRDEHGRRLVAEFVVTLGACLREQRQFIAIMEHGASCALAALETDASEVKGGDGMKARPETRVS